MLEMLFTNRSHLNWRYSIVLSVCIIRTSVNIQLTNVMRSTIGKMQRMVKSLPNLRADSDWRDFTKSFALKSLKFTGHFTIICYPL